MEHDELFEGSRFIRLAQMVPGVIPASRSSIWRWVRKKKFPAPVKLSPGVTAWRWSEVKAWLDARSAARSTT
ncbi:MAG: AlpA family phage regulatory protein [Candidatus Microthrix sp.]|nr:AlpA family phage regulatory protein [Candidatus Microthrix sp.]